MPSKQFKVAAVSANTNSFGLTGLVLVAADGEAWQVGANSINRKDKGTVLTVPVTDAGSPQWHGFGFEIPHRLTPDAPPAVVSEVWN